jgi:hypothetical protein
MGKVVFGDYCRDFDGLERKVTFGDYVRDDEPLADPDLVAGLVGSLKIRDEDSDRIKVAKAKAVLELAAKMGLI